MLKINDNDKILIVRLSALGDCVHTIPLVCAIKKAFPNIFIGWAVSENAKDIIINNPIIDKVHIIPKNDHKKYAEVMSQIRKEKYTISIDSQELLKSALISFSSNAKYKLAHDNSREFAHIFANKKLKPIPLFDSTRHVIERNLDFARYLGIDNPEIDFVLPPTSNENKDYIQSLLKDIDPNKKTILLSPTTTWITKFWTKENWAKIIDELNNRVNIILTGTKADTTYINEILSLTTNANTINLAGKTNLLQLIELYKNTDIMISLDSGSTHLASAVKKPIIISLCGATSNIRNGAWGTNNINLSLDLTCQPCYKKTCKFKDGIPECMTAITTDTVIEEIKRILRQWI